MLFQNRPNHKKMLIPKINIVMKYVPTKSKKPIVVSISTLLVNNSQQLYSLMLKPKSILQIIILLNKGKTNRSSLADAECVLFFTLQN